MGSLVAVAEGGTALDVHQLANGCWCGESYYQGADGVGRVVTNVGPVQTWQVLLKTHPRLAVESWPPDE